MRQRGETKVRFTPALWARWLARFNGDGYSMRLHQGIQEFRSLLARAEKRKRHL